MSDSGPFCFLFPSRAKKFIMTASGLAVLVSIFMLQCLPTQAAPEPRQRIAVQAEEDPQPVPVDNGGVSAKDGFIGGLISSFSMIVVSELGDKTFFIAAIMAMRHSRLIVFAGAITALGLMTVLSGKKYIL